MKKSLLVASFTIAVIVLIAIYILSFYQPQLDKIGVNNWSYKIDLDVEKSSDSIQPIAQITFHRKTPVFDTNREEIYKKDWYPSMSFDVFNVSDRAFCQRVSMRTKTLSSCLPPDVGGDLIIVQNYIFLNRSVCLNCVGSEDILDYCRPVVNKVLSDVSLEKIESLKDLNKHLEKKITRIK